MRTNAHGKGEGAGGGKVIVTGEDTRREGRTEAR